MSKKQKKVGDLQTKESGIEMHDNGSHTTINTKNEQTNLIEKIGLFFASNFRVSILFIVGFLILGSLAYTSFLKREGFPAINYPIGTIDVNYAVDDNERVNQDVVESLEEVLDDRDNIDVYQAFVLDNRANITIVFTSEVQDADEEIQEIKQRVETQDIPESASINYGTFNRASINGVDDLILNVTFEGRENQDFAKEEVKQLQNISQEILLELENLDGVKEIRLVEQFSEQTTPTGETVELRDSFNRIAVRDNGDLDVYDAVNIGLQKEVDIGAVEFSDLIKEKIDELLELDKYSEYKIIFGYDPAELVESQIASLEGNVIAGLVILSVALFFIIGWRSSLIIAVFIPVVLCMSFVWFILLGYTLNTITLFGLILVLGVIADDAIVVLEAIDYYKRKGVRGYMAVKEALRDIGIADVAGTITTVLVFLPLTFVTGVLGEFITQIPITVIVTLLSSLFVGLTIVSFMSNLLFKANEDKKPEHENAPSQAIQRILNAPANFIQTLGTWLASFVRGYTKNGWGVYAVIIASIFMIVGFVGILGPKVGDRLFPPAKDSNDVLVTLTFEENIQIQQAEEITKNVETEIINDFSEYINKLDYIVANSRQAILNITLEDYNDRDIKSPEIAESIDEEFSNINNARLSSIAGGAGGPPPSDFPASVSVVANDYQTLNQVTRDIQNFVKGQRFNDYEVGVKETRINYTQTLYKEDGKRIAEVDVAFEEGSDSQTLTQLEQKVEEEFTDAKLGQYNLTTDDVYVDLGQEEDFQDSFDAAVIAFFAAVILMYGFLVVLLGSFTQPLLIFVAVPFTLPGMMTGLFLTENDFSFFVFIGFTALFGIVVNNTIIILSYANNLIRNEGYSLEEAVAETVQVRSRPIIATTLTTLGGLIPLALTDPFWEALAVTIITGLFSSLILVLTAFPAYYIVVEKLRLFKNNLLSGWLDPENR